MVHTCAGSYSSILCVQVLVSLGQASNGGTNPAALRQSVPQDTVTGLFRDMRGIAIATNSRRTYGETSSSREHLTSAIHAQQLCRHCSAAGISRTHQAVSRTLLKHCMISLPCMQACCLIGCIQRTLRPSWQRLRHGPTSQRYEWARDNHGHSLLVK